MNLVTANVSSRPSSFALVLLLTFSACGPNDAVEAVVEAATERAPQGGPQIVRLSTATMSRQAISTATAVTRVIQETLVAPAHVAFDGDAVANVAVRTAGRVVAVHKKLGDRVAVGDVLFAIESRELGEAQSELLTHRSAALALAPVVRLAEESWQRGKALFEESQGIASNEVLRRESEYRVAEAELAAATNGARAAEDRLRLLGASDASIDQLLADGTIRPRCEVTAPIAGQVVERSVVIGDQVTPESGPRMRLCDPSRRWVVAAVTEADAARVVVGAEASVRALHASGSSLATTVQFVAPMLDEGTRSLQVRLSVPADTAGLYPGMFAEVEIAASAPTGDAALPIAIPSAAVQTLDHRTVVFVPVGGEAGAFAVREVAVSRSVGGHVAVESGLRAGEVVVTEGSFVLKAQATQVGTEEER